MIVYKSTNIINGKCYVGQTTKPLQKRVQAHLCNSKYERDTSPYFHRALRKYGENNFIWKVLCECNTKEELNEMEIYHIQQNPDNYNIGKGGEGSNGGCGRPAGFKHTDVTKKRIGEANKGNTYSLGRKQTQKVKDSLRKANERSFLITYPNGDTKVIVGLKQFAVEEGLNPVGLSHCATKRQKTHKGFRCEYDNDNEED
jgi:group I intron endonuclease